MEIKYDELELLELFYTEGESLTGDIEDGEILYSRVNEYFKVTMFIYTYEQKINIFLQYNGQDITSVELSNISALKKEDNYLKVYENEQIVATICFKELFSINVEK